MHDIVIQAEKLGKKYVIGHQAETEKYTALRDVLAQNARGLWHKTRDLVQGKPIIQGDSQEEVWALKDVSFEIRRGEVVGIIGRNGAGKSTLLKILSRITEPSSGRVTIKGRVASLLEVGTGFHPELSGRENVYLNGAILGMTRAEIRRKFDEIVAFAEVERFLDTPVKRYSSGMYVRLAFAVAAHLEPEILVVDEVLAVGDAQFQKKCLGKMGDVAKEGRTVLFVSHNMLAMQSLCQRAILLVEGQRLLDGYVHDVIARYMRDTATSAHVREWQTQETAPGNRVARIKKIEISSGRGTLPVVQMNESFDICVEYWLLQGEARAGVTLRVINDQNITVFATSTEHDPHSPRNQDATLGLYRSTVHIPANLMNSGNYHIDLLIVSIKEENYIHPGIASFEVVQSSDNVKHWYGRPAGIIHPIFEWQTEKL